tara:strand:- start:535 stop:2058 length:1524 start_codon:yes stop_codon:yes gene_type:complete
MYDRFEYNGTLKNYPSKTNWYWITHPDNNYTNFDFDYHTPEWESYCVQVFGDQHSKNSHTYLVNKEHDDNSPWQFHENKVDRIGKVPVFHATNFQPDETEGVRMFSNFFNFIKRCCNKTDSDFFWITSSVCDYSSFDFTWHPDIGEEKFLHTWTTQDNKYGYTFFVPRQEFMHQCQTLEKLEWFKQIKYHYEVGMTQLPVSFFSLENGVAETIKHHKFTHHYEWFVEQGVMFDTEKFQPSRWDNIQIETYGRNSNALLVPREAKSFVLDQVYDYPYIVNKPYIIQEPKFDMFVLGYKEPDLERNYEEVKLQYPNAKLVSGIQGNVNAYKECARQSKTEYFWIIFAKSKINKEFTFDYHPNCMERPHHHIFKCYNPMIDYAYGHMGIVLYHKKMVLDATKWGPDFTCSFPVKLIDQISNTANYFQTDFLTYRTAFRECVKLASNCIKGSDPNTNSMILDKWLNNSKGTHADWNQQGAEDAVKFVAEDQDLNKIWDWNFINSMFQKHTL